MQFNTLVLDRWAYTPTLEAASGGSCAPDTDTRQRRLRLTRGQIIRIRNALVAPVVRLLWSINLPPSGSR